MDVKEAAKMLRVHTQTIYNMLDRGEFKGATKIGVSWDIPASEINRIREERLARMEKADDLSSSSDLLGEFYASEVEDSLFNVHCAVSLFDEKYRELKYRKGMTDPLDLKRELQPELESLQSSLEYLQGTKGIFYVMQKMRLKSRKLDREAAESLKSSSSDDVKV